MQGLWSRARECRPSIYKPQEAPLLSAYKDDPLYDKFEEFFRGFVKSAKPGNPLDIYDMHALFALACGSKPDYLSMLSHFNADGYPVLTRNLLPGILRLRSLLLEFTTDGEKATELSLRYGKELAMKGCLPYQDPVKRGISLYEIENVILRSVLKRSTDRLSIVGERLDEDYKALPSTECVSEGDVSDEMLIALKEKITARHQAGLFFYPMFEPRIVAVLGNDIGKSLFEIGGPGRKSFEIGKWRHAVIAMYPWEADHIAKAEELSRREITAAEPSGRVIINELEFALFKWVEGLSIEEVAHDEPWELYGKLIRKCHEQGVVVGDPAARNAIWTGNQVRLIDFEHVEFKDNKKPLAAKERLECFERISYALKRRDAMDAFIRGYNS